MQFTLNRHQAGRFPEGTLVEVDRLLADPERGVYADKVTFEGNWDFSIRLTPRQLREVLPYSVGLYAVASMTGQGRATFLREWVDSGGSGGRTVAFINVDGDTSKGKLSGDNILEIPTDQTSDIRPIFEGLPKGSVVIIDTASNIQSENPQEGHSPLEDAQALADEALERGLMVILSVQRRRYKVGTGIEIIPLRRAPKLKIVETNTEFVKAAIRDLLEKHPEGYQVSSRDLGLLTDCPCTKEEIQAVGQANPFMVLEDGWLALYSEGEDLWVVARDKKIVTAPVA